MSRLIVLIGILLVACGAGPNGTNGADGENGRDGKNGDDGSSCHVEELDENSARIYCDDGSEITVTNGQDGSDAEATRIIESFFCTGGLENTTLSFTYNAVLMSSQDLFVTGSVSSLLTTVSDTRFYAPSQNGWQTAAVHVLFDQDGTVDGGWFSLSLNRSTLVTLIEYRPSNPGTISDTWTMQPESCVHNMY